MSYKISIEKIEKREAFATQWKDYTQELRIEVLHGSINPDTLTRLGITEEEAKHIAKYGGNYISHKTVENYTVEVYSQEVEELDLTKVILAVNNVEIKSASSCEPNI